jgi:hypothetical protein
MNQRTVNLCVHILGSRCHNKRVKSTLTNGENSRDVLGEIFEHNINTFKVATEGKRNA